MGLKKLEAKLADHNERVKNGKARKIRPGDVEKILKKLQKKRFELDAKIASARSEEKKDRLEGKLVVAKVQVERAEWLLQELQQRPGKLPRRS